MAILPLLLRFVRTVLRLALRSEDTVWMGCRMKKDAGVPCPERPEKRWLTDSASNGAFFPRL